MKVVILFCFICVIAITVAQVPPGMSAMSGRGGASAMAAAGGSSDAMRAMMMSRMLSGRGGFNPRSMAQILLLRGAIEPMEYFLCLNNQMYCMTLLNA